MPKNPAEQLRDRGLRVTATRIAVLESLDHGSHLPADALAVAVRARAGSVSTQGLYNALGDLVRVGLVHRIEPAGSPALYELGRKEAHHHLVCRSCSAVVDLDCDHGQEACLQPRNDHGYAALEAEIVFWGTCPACQSATG